MIELWEHRIVCCCRRALLSSSQIRARKEIILGKGVKMHDGFFDHLDTNKKRNSRDIP